MSRALLALPLLLLAAACQPQDEEYLPPEPGPLQAGLARARLPAPVGVGTAGYGPFGAPSSPSPFADIYPGTTRVHGHPEVRVLALSRGAGFEVVFVRLDVVGVFQQLREGLIQDLEARLGRNLDHALLMGATHTHSGPGRLLDAGGIFDMVADTFHPEMNGDIMDAIAGAVEDAFHDLQDARVGHVVALAEDGHRDRRCEDGLEYENSALPVLAVERGGELDALVMAYAVHGTVLGISDLTLSREVMGAIEQAVEDRFQRPVMALAFNSWGGDMSPASPDVPEQEGADQPDGYERMDRVAAAVARDVEEALPALLLDAEPEISLKTYRTRIDRGVLGYDDDTFPYEYGAVYCSSDADCDPETIEEDLDRSCVPFPEDWPAPDQTLSTVGRIGDLHLATFTGEPGTLLAEAVMAGMGSHDGVEDVMFLGYTQDYLGYSILEDDWWQGGYEASGHLWGPRQGSYLADFVVEAFDAFQAGQPLMGQPAALDPFPPRDFEPYAPTAPTDLGAILVDVEPTYEVDQVVSFTVAGADPWLGAPTATLETSAGESVTRPGGHPVDSDGYHFWVDLLPDPPYGEDATERLFKWTFNMPAQRRHDLHGPSLEGDYRFRVSIPTDDGAVTVKTGVFHVAPSH